VWDAALAVCTWIFGDDDDEDEDDDQTANCPSPYDVKDYTLATVERNNCFYKECSRYSPGSCCDVNAQIFIRCN